MFIIYKSTPGDPVEMMIGGNRTNMRPEMYEQQYKQVEEMLGLNKPLPVQYFSWIGNMLTGNFGYSTQYRRQVIDIIGSPMRNTILLNLCSMVVVFLISVPLGIATAVRKNSIFDKAVQVMNIGRFLLIDPQDLIHAALESRLPQSDRRKFFSKIIPVHHAELLDRIGAGAVLPPGPDLLALGTGPVFQDIPAHIYKKLICVAHLLLSIPNIAKSPESDIIILHA